MHSQYSISLDKTTWEQGVLSNALAVALLGLLDQEQIAIVNYSLKEGYYVNINGTFMRLSK
ncbi:MAG: hypothetical protein E7231_03255 [Cellulosilyticum sp.]|nr:hypothetical protein [Cellulosilyticum sp.]